MVTTTINQKNILPAERVLLDQTLTSIYKSTLNFSVSKRAYKVQKKPKQYLFMQNSSLEDSKTKSEGKPLLFKCADTPHKGAPSEGKELPGSPWC